MVMGRQPSLLKLNLAISLLLKVSIASYACEALAESSHNEGLSKKSLPPSESQILNSTAKDRVSPIILSQVQNPTENPQPRVPDSILPAPLPPKPEQPVPIPQPVPETPLDITPPTPSPIEETPGSPRGISVERFEFEGNTVFSDEQLRKITEKFLNKNLTFSQLLQVETEITKLYTDAGYVNSGAVIATGQELEPKGAIIKVQIVEGGVEAIQITGTRRLNSSYIRRRIKLGVSRPLNRNRLLKALQLLQLNPLVDNLSAELSAGSRPEESVLKVNVVEADSFRTELFVDNGRTPSVGSFRRGISISEGNVSGFGDAFFAAYSNTDGSNTLDLSYTAPVNARNGSIIVQGGFTDAKVIEPPFDDIDLKGDSFYVNVGFRQPIIQTPTRELALGFTLSREQSRTELLGEGYSFLSPGADDNGETRVSALRFYQEYTQRSSQQVLALRSQFNLGVGWFDSSVRTQAPDSRFFSWRGQGQYVRSLAQDTLFVFRTDVQLATRALVPLEQLGLGGLQSVRGYRQDELLVDNGVLASAEVRFPILRVRNLDGLLQVAPFVDFGVGWNSSGRENRNPNTLVGVGVGLRWQMGDRLNARFDYGIPLTDVESRDGDRTLQERGFYFSVNFSPF
ncbi:hemolysin activation/secretion protein [Scytonema hofmannii PCC 7110]|uniref:Hemolysin activation/secretion protein n=1 Tax=Scytonema hofmannii PCC 7110 TaxID=128403 RepID=A0A139WT10_9CYAN|nr:ShlB/FhaC/HecB family hemolysin secretion/activation protein [Scytonema hofmannii]KYC35572.1 hemolysin activation/secretion protein [Scytonema hofmannii PCC 7110]